MLKETETEETIVFFVTFLSLAAIQLEGARPPWAPLWLRLWSGGKAPSRWAIFCNFLGKL